MGFESVENFRVLLISDSDDDSCRIYRSGKHDRISQEDYNRFKELRIRFNIRKSCSFFAHLWGAYAIPVALSGVRRPSFVVRRTSCVVCVHHNYQK